MALAARHKKSKHRVFVILGDGECNEGSVWEAAMCAGKHQLSNLIALVDYNKMQSAGATAEIQNLEPFADKWKSFGFAVRQADGHNVAELREVLAAIPFGPEKPNVVLCHSVKGKGVPFVENNLQWHHKSSLKDQEIDALLAGLEE